MKRTLGFIVGGAGVLALGVALLAPSLPGDAARMAEIADYGRAVTSSSRQIVLIAGVALIALAGALTRR